MLNCQKVKLLAWKKTAMKTYNDSWLSMLNEVPFFIFLLNIILIYYLFLKQFSAIYINMNKNSH